MIRERVLGLYSILLVLQIVFGIALFWIWYSLFEFFFHSARFPFADSYFTYSLLLALGLLAEFATRRHEQRTLPLGDRSFIPRFPLAIRQTAWAIGTVMVFLVLAKDRALSRIFLVSFVPALFLLLIALNVYGPGFLSRRFFSGQRSGRALLVGPRSKLAAIRGWLEQRKHLGLGVAGLLTEPDGSDPDDAGPPLLGTPADLDAAIERHRITHVILLDLPPEAALKPIVDACLRRGVRLLALDELDQRFHHPVARFEDGDLHFVTLHEEPLENPFNRGMKRAFDLAVALPVVILVLPPAALVAGLLQRLQSPGPLFYRQRRAGLLNTEFTMLKFRTMHTDHGNETAQATADDPRVFPGGRWMRRTSFDELPQFINVLRGEMSVVGPRPHLVQHNVAFARALRDYHIRSFMKPGITGLAQVRGFRGQARSEGDIRARLASDLLYLENWSPILDLAILLRTLLQMFLPPKSAY